MTPQLLWLSGLLVWLGLLADASYAVLMESWGYRCASRLSQLLSWLLS